MIWFVVIFAVSVLMQFFFGNIHPESLAFPLSAALVLLLGYLSFAAGRFSPHKGIYSLTSHKAVFVAFGVMICAALVVGFTPQVSAFEPIPFEGVAGRLGLYHFMSSWIFIGVVMFFLIVLGAVTYRRFGAGMSLGNISFLLNHAGLWIAVTAAVVGSCDMIESRAAVYRGKPTNVAYVSERQTHTLPFDVMLDDFSLTLHDTGEPMEFKAGLTFSDGDHMQSAEIKVNHPFRYRGYDIYLSSYDTTAGNDSAYCILQFIRQPWGLAVYVGIVIMLAGALMMFITGLGKRKADELG